MIFEKKKKKVFFPSELYWYLGTNVKKQLTIYACEFISGLYCVPLMHVLTPSRSIQVVTNGRLSFPLIVE